jgi:hypothetical protein
MTVLEKVMENPAASELWSLDHWVVQGGVWWLKRGDDDEHVDVREAAVAMNAVSARFITITAYQLPGAEGFRLEYHWDVEGRLLGFPFNIAGSSDGCAKIESIVDLCEAADWIEREVHEGFGIEFTGREYKPLLLREGDTPGMNLRDVASAKPPAGTSAQEAKQ